jgi:hypothetical protein
MAFSCLVFAASGLSMTAARSAPADSSTTPITVNGDGGDKTYQGVGAVLGGGGNARYLMDYPAAQRTQILDYLFKPGYGASLQILKLEIGGGTNSTDGAEPSIEPQMVPTNQANRFCSTTYTPASPCINCDAGYEFSIAYQALQRNPNMIFYGLQWTAPAWVTGRETDGKSVSTGGAPTLFTVNDITYLIDWLNCAKQRGLTINYLGGWNENAGGDTTGVNTYWWYSQLRTDLDNAGFTNVQIIAGDLNPQWEFASDASPDPYPDIDVLGAHDVCHYPNEELTNGNAPTCNLPVDPTTKDAYDPAKQLWASELGAMDAGAQSGCTEPCAPAMDRSLVRGYNQARLVGYLEWPVIDAMPVLGNTEEDTPLPYENRGLITADQPWSGNYSVNAMTWAIAQVTDFVTAPTATSRWVYQDTGTGLLPATGTGLNDGGSYVTLIHQTKNPITGIWQGDGFTTIVETTTATTSQQLYLDITGGSGVSGGLASEPVHIWSSNFDFSSQFDEPQYWLWHRGDTTAATLASSGYTLQKGFVYTFTTWSTNASSATSQAPGSPWSNPPTPPASASLALPYTDSLATPGPNAGSSNGLPLNDDEPQYLDAQDGSFEIVPCPANMLPPGGYTNCTGQTTGLDSNGDQPVFWHPASSGVRYPNAIIGDGSWSNYTESVNMLLPAGHASGGLIGYYTERSDANNPGNFNGYIFDLSTTGAWQLVANTTSGPLTPPLASGTFSWPTGYNASTWNNLALSFSDGASCTSPEPSTDVQVLITASIDGTLVGSSTVCAADGGLAGIEAGYASSSTTENWPAVLYSGLNVT